MASAKWYVAHTYSGYENKVMTDIMKTVENRNMADVIQEVRVPMEEVVETKNGEQKVVLRKSFPSYVMVKMHMTDESWYVIRNTRGVTGFVGPGSKPVPLTDEEVAAIGIEVRTVELKYNVGDSVKITGGPLAGFVGVVEEISSDKKKIKVMASMFGRETPVELETSSVERIKD